MGLSNNEVEQSLEKFVKHFISIFESSLSVYHQNLIEEIPKAGKWANLVSWVFQLSGTASVIGVGAAGGDEGVKMATAITLPLLGVILSNVGMRYNRQKLKKLIHLLEVFQNDKEQNQNQIRKCLIQSAVSIFASFEIQFKDATVHRNHEFAIIKLARDAADRSFNFFKKNIIEEKDFFTVSNITKSIILGKSRRHKSLFSMPKRYLGWKLDNNITTEKIFELSSVLKIASEDESYCYAIDKNQNSPNFRLVLTWEENNDDIDSAPIQWGVDNKIILFKNRVYKKGKSFNKSFLNNLVVANYTEEELEEIQFKLFNEITVSSEQIEESLKAELEELRETLRSDVVYEIGKLEKEIIDLKDIMITTLESLVELRDEGKKFENKLGFFNERKFNLEETIEIALGILKAGRDKETIEKAATFESIIWRLKNHLSTVEATNDMDLYIQLDGCYDISFPDVDRFLLLDKVNSFIKSFNKRILFILGESGSGKTSFLIYLTQFLLKLPFLVARDRRVIPFYIRLSSPNIQNFRDLSSEDIFKAYYNLSEKEIGLLSADNQSFCFIFDDLDALKLNFKNFYLIYLLYNKFPSSHFIFTACLDKFKSEKEFEDLFTFIYPYGEQKLKLLQEKTIMLAPFSVESIKNYIGQFFGKRRALKLDSENVEAIYQRINALPSLNGIIRRPIFLMMTIDILSSLETFYQQSEIVPEVEAIEKDLFHLYTHVIYTQASLKIKENKGLTSVNGIGIYNCILNYSIKLAQLMQATDIKEIDKDQLFESKNLFSIATGSTLDQHNEYKRCFSTRYNNYLFKDGEEFKLYKYGHQGCKLLHTHKTSGRVSYLFKHNKFLDYFGTLFAVDKERRNQIQEFMDNYKPSVLLPTLDKKIFAASSANEKSRRESILLAPKKRRGVFK